MFDLTRPAVLAPMTLVIGYLTYVLWQTVWPSHLPNLPVVGSKTGDWLPLLQARWRNSTNYRAVADEMDTTYKDRPCLVPVGGSETIVLLPASETQHIADQPDSVLDMPQPMIQGLQFRYTVRDQVIIEEPLHQKTVARDLTHQISYLVEDMVEETEWGFERYWGMDSSGFIDVAVYDTLRRIIGSVTNRIFVGLPTGRDPALVDAGMSYAAALPQEAGKLRMYPAFAKPLVAPFYTKRTRAHTRAFYDILMPEIKQRLQEYDDLHHQASSPEHGATRGGALKSDRNDFLAWSIPQAKAHRDPRMANPDTLAGRVLMLNFGAIHTTSFTLTHAVFDLFSSTQANVDELRSEISTALDQHGGQWSKKALQQMDRLDSLVREALRLNMASTFGVPRLVVGRDGFVTRSGLVIPRGNIVAVPGKNIARDERLYDDAGTFRPFRFAEKRKEEGVEFIKRARQAAPTTTAEFLPFGHGKHACPGRFFAVTEMKLILGYMVMNYDIEMLDERPADIYAGVAKLPPMASKIRVRRRENGM